MQKSDLLSGNISKMRLNSMKITPATLERKKRNPTLKIYKRKNVTIAVKTQLNCLDWILERKELIRHTYLSKARFRFKK